MTTHVLTLGQRIDAERRTLAAAITERHYELDPALEARYGAAGREKCLQDAEFHLSYLADAASSESESLFADYAAWARVMLAARGVPAEDLARNLAVLRDVLAAHLPEHSDAVARIVGAALERLPGVGAELPPALDPAAPLADLAKAYVEALLLGDRRRASRMVLDAVDAGTRVADVYMHVLQPVQHEIGRLWQMNLLSVAQEHFCTAATQLVMSQLYPYIVAGERNGRTLVATSVSGDLHEIGVRMVGDFFEMEGWETIYLGASTPAAAVVATVLERKADALALSATITSHVRRVAEVVAAVRGAEGAQRVKILVGGYPFNVDPDLWRRVGADGSARDAREAVAVASRLLGEKRAE